MKIRPLLAAAALTCGTLGTGSIALSAGAGAASTVQLRFANSSAYNFPSGDSHGFCIDGDFAGVVASGAVSAPLTVTTGEHFFVALSEGDTDCSAEAYDSAFFDVPDTPSVTVILNNGNAVKADSNLQLLPDDLSCPAAGQGRLVVRHGAFVSQSELEMAIDFYAATGSADPAKLVEDVALAGEGSTDLAPGAYMKARAGMTGGTYNDASEVPPGTFDIEAGKVTFVYLAGGWDGSPGSYTLTLDADCATTPTTPTTAPTTTVPAKVAPVAIPVATQPTYTG